MTIDLHQQATELATAVAEIAKMYRFDGRWYEAVEMLDAALVVDELSPYDRARLQVPLAGFLIKHADYDRAENLLAMARDQMKDVDDPSLEAELLYELGEVAYFRTMLHGHGTYETAHQFHQQVLHIREKMKDDIGKIASWSRIGILYERDGNDEEALKLYERSIALSEKIGYPLGKKRPLTHIGAFHHRNGDIATALDYYEQSLAISQETGEADGMMFGLMNVGYGIFRLKSDGETALPFLQEACEMAEKIGHKMAMCVVHMRLGLAYAAVENRDKAKQHYQVMAAVAEAYGFDGLREHAMGELEALQTS